MRWPWRRKGRAMHQPVPDPDGLEEFPPTGLHNRDGQPGSMRCRCGRPRTRRRLVALDGSERVLLYCPSCDQLAPWGVNRPRGKS